MKLTLVLLSFLVASKVFGQSKSDSSMDFTLYWPCAGNASFCATRILAQGTIQADTAQKFAAFLQRIAKRPDLPSHPTVVFDSPGGNLQGAMALGRSIRRFALSTDVQPTYFRVVPNTGGEEEAFVRNAHCASACVLAFAGGLQRSAGPEAKLGVHQFASKGGVLGEGGAQIVIVGLASYLQHMGISRDLLDIASLVPPNSMHWLTPDQVVKLKLDNTQSAAAQWLIGATSEGRPYLQLTQDLPSGRRITLTWRAFGANAILELRSVFERSIHSERLKLFPIGEPAHFTIEADERSVALMPQSDWKAVSSASTVTFIGVASIGLRDLGALTRAMSLKIKDDFPNALSDLAVSVDLPIAGLGPGLALLSRAN